MVWAILMGICSTWLSCIGGVIVVSGILISMLGVIGAFVMSGVVDLGWLGTAIDRVGSAVCLVWLIVFEGAFFFGAVWA